MGKERVFELLSEKGELLFMTAMQDSFDDKNAGVRVVSVLRELPAISQLRVVLEVLAAFMSKIDEKTWEEICKELHSTKEELLEMKNYFTRKLNGLDDAEVDGALLPPQDDSGSVQHQAADDKGDELHNE